MYQGIKIYVPSHNIVWLLYNKIMEIKWNNKLVSLSYYLFIYYINQLI
jgi:hypothetical protein